MGLTQFSRLNFRCKLLYELAHADVKINTLLGLTISGDRYCSELATPFSCEV
jgi:hypothetical protein